MKEKNKEIILFSFKPAFSKSIPVMAGYVFLGMSYGILMRVNGFSFIYPMIMSLCIYGGSLEFVTVSMLMSEFNPLQALIMSLIIQARHIFYGLSMLPIYKNTGKKKFFLIYMMSDETFAVNYSTEVHGNADRGWFMLFVSILDYFYWFAGATSGGILGSFIKFSTDGLSFVMTAMFIVIFIDNWMKEKGHISSLIGFFVTLAFLILLGKDHFMIPAMIFIVFMLIIMRKKISAGYKEKETEEKSCLYGSKL